MPPAYVSGSARCTSGRPSAERYVWERSGVRRHRFDAIARSEADLVIDANVEDDRPARLHELACSSELARAVDADRRRAEPGRDRDDVERCGRILGAAAVDLRVTL